MAADSVTSYIVAGGGGGCWGVKAGIKGWCSMLVES